MTKRKRLQYKGPSTDIKSNPWIRLVHGRHYEVEVKEMSSGKVRMRIFEGVDVARVSYETRRDFEMDWC